MFTERGTMAWMCMLLFVAVAVSFAIGSEDDLSNEPKSEHLMRRVHSLESWNRRHWRGITGNGNGNSNKQTTDELIKQWLAENFIPNTTQAIQTFSVSMYHLLKIGNPNFVFSPYSVHRGLTMTYLGATQQTAEEMLQVLGLKGLKKEDITRSYSPFTFLRTGKMKLYVANRVFVDLPFFPIKDEFTKVLYAYFLEGAEIIQFRGRVRPNVPINLWVSEKTAGMIPALESFPMDRLTAMIIVNAIYFKGKWQDKFNADKTKEEDFYVTKDIKMKVPLMTKEGIYNYTESDELKAAILELPYIDYECSMFIILPKIRNGLDAVEERLTSASLTRALDSLASKRKIVFLPKFKAESDFKLKETLTQMGMVKAFEQAEFDGISSDHRLRITEVLHKAVIEVTEEGTRDAGVTSGDITDVSSQPQTMEFRADHPFIYIVRNNMFRLIYFVGKYSGQK